MTHDECIQVLNDSHPETGLAMDALFAFSDAMNKGVAMDDLCRVMGVAIDEGFENLSICLGMAMIAAERAKEGQKRS